MGASHFERVEGTALQRFRAIMERKTQEAGGTRSYFAYFRDLKESFEEAQVRGDWQV
jgi:hypothetical protein